MSKLMYEVEYVDDDEGGANYMYIETDDDIDITAGDNGNVTHITTIDTDMGLTPDLIIRRDNNG